MKWQTKTICTFVAASVPMEKAGDVNPLLEAAHKIGEEDADQRNDEQKPPGGVVDPPSGSYERFMATFGSPRRWAGRS